MASNNYQQEFNKQLSQQLQSVRKAQPNHIPVYAMKYKNASKYFIDDLEEPLALFPKAFKLKSIHQIIQKQSIKYSLNKLKTDKKVIQQGDNFKPPQFYLYTIEMRSPQQKENQAQSLQKQNKKDKKALGKFVKLNLDMTYEQAFNKYGRENVLTIVYTDASQMRRQYDKAKVTVLEKWLTRIIIFILILVLIPYLMKSHKQNLDTLQTQKSIQFRNFNNQSINKLLNEEFVLQDSIDILNQMDVDLQEPKIVESTKERTLAYDQEVY